MVSKKVHNFPVEFDEASTTKSRNHSHHCKDEQLQRVKWKIRAEARFEERSDGLCIQTSV